MGDEKNLNNSQLNIDTENVKPNLHEIFQNPRLIWELYKNLSLSDTYALNSLENLSHYITVKKLYEDIPNIDKFASSKKTLKSCFNWEIEEMFFLYMALFPSMFSSFKELYMWKTSWQNYLNRLNDEDLKILDSITTIPNNLSNKQIISEIRNALNHTHYVQGKDDLYIKNPKNADPKIHARDFEASVPYKFLLDFIVLTQNSYRRSDYFEYFIDDQELLGNLWENKKDIKYEYVKDKIHFYQGVTKDKFWDEDSVKEEVRKEMFLSKQLDNLMLKYFSNHKLDKKNLRYIAESLVKAPEIHMREIFSAIISKEIIWNNRYKWLNSVELLDDVYGAMINWSYYWYFDWFDGIEWFESFDCAEVKKLLVNFWKELEKKRQPNWQSILKHSNWCREYACKYLEKHGFLLYDKWDVEHIEKWNISIPSVCIQAVIDKLSSHYYVINNMIKLFPNWLRLQLIKLVYVNEQINIKNRCNRRWTMKWQKTYSWTYKRCFISSFLHYIRGGRWYRIAWLIQEKNWFSRSRGYI